jgi:hypothetical protein
MATYEERMEARRRRAAEEEAIKAASAQPAQTQNPTETEKTFSGFMKNLGTDVFDFAKGITAPLHSNAEFQKGLSDIMFRDGEHSTEGWKEMGGQIVDRAKEIVSDPGDAFYERPLSTGLDVVGAVVPPLRGASMVAGARGANAVSDGLSTVANAVENFDPMSWPATGAAMVNRAGTQMGVLDDSVRRTEGVIKPKLNERHKQSNPEYRSTVINGALERGIDPTEKGMSNLQDQQSKVFAEMNKIMDEVGDRQINTTELVDGWEAYAMQHIDRSDVDWEDMVKGVKAKTGKLQRQYRDHPDGEIVSINSAGLRSARQSADGKVNHNARNQEGDSVQAELDRLYSHYLREQLANAVPEMKHLTEEASALYDIYDMYNPAVVRMSNHNPISLPVSNAITGTGVAGAVTGSGMDNPALSVAGTALAALPLIANAKGTRIGQARSNYETGKAGLGDPITGGLLRDRNGSWSDGRKGVNYIENLFSSVMGEEEER